MSEMIFCWLIGSEFKVVHYKESCDCSSVTLFSIKGCAKLYKYCIAKVNPHFHKGRYACRWAFQIRLPKSGKTKLKEIERC